MSISPASDIVLDVAKAADPARVADASKMLGAARARPSSRETFASYLPQQSAMAPRVSASEARSAQRQELVRPPADPRAKAIKGLEEFFLQSVVETMLPKSEDLFGAGSAGDVWRSMMAEQLAKQIGRSVDLGLAGPRSLSARTISVAGDIPSLPSDRNKG